jgi:protein-tyrosine phosphatase
MKLKKYQIKKVHNFRTVGSIKNADGRTLKEGSFTEVPIFINLKRNLLMILKTWDKEIIDLRNSKEIAQKPDHLPDGIIYKKYSAFEDEGDQLAQAKKLVLKGKVNASDADKRMIDFIVNM